MMQNITDPKVAAAYDAFPPEVRNMAIILRALIYDVALQTHAVGPLHETLKWGQPAFLTSVTKSGSTLRIGAPRTGGCALYAHCATTIISSYVATFPDADKIEGNRAVHFSQPDDIVPARLRLLIRHALTYHI